MLSGKTVVLGVTGGIAAYKACEIVSRLKKLHAEVFVVMTKNATEFVAPLTFETLSGNKVATSTFDKVREFEIGHISLAKRADVFVVAPATANAIAKFAHGIADDILSTTALAAKCPKIVCPAMNTTMLDADATIANLEVLKKRGWQILEPESGLLACGDIGRGKLSAPIVIVENICKALLPKQTLKGKTIVVTAGATRESLDGVRFLSNESSGKMGVAVANAAAKRGANVIFVRGYVSGNSPLILGGGTTSVVEGLTTEEMKTAVLENFETADALIMAAAPADYRPKVKAQNKIKEKSLTLELEKTPDIAKAAGAVKGGKKLVIFAAETENAEKNAVKKLTEKNADLVVLNDVMQEGAGFNCDTNIVTIIGRDKKPKAYPKLLKSEVAEIILDSLELLWSQG